MIEQLSNPWWAFVALGICAGLLGGALGLGGGVVIVPSLVLIFGFAQKSAQGTALAVMVPMALVGALRYWRNPAIEINALPVGLIICGSLVGVLIGTELASRLPSPVLRKVFATYLIIAAIRIFWAPAKPPLTAHDNSMTEQNTVTLTEHGETDNEPEN